MLPVDAYYPDLGLVVEYCERQHMESVAFFDRRLTVSGVGRGEQRRKYDQRRRELLPAHRLQLVEIAFSQLKHTKSKRLMRDSAADLEVLRARLKPWCQ